MSSKTANGTVKTFVRLRENFYFIGYKIKLAKQKGRGCGYKLESQQPLQKELCDICSYGLFTFFICKDL